MNACCIVTILVIFSQFKVGQTNENFNVFDKIKSGFKMAGEFFSSEHASKVANLVSKALGGQPGQKNKEEKPNNIFSGFLRLFGFESRQISAIAINAIILVGQLIGTTLKTPSEVDHKDDEDTPFEWMINNSVISHLITDTEDEKLSEKVIEYVTERSLDEETGCVQLLICKMKPFIKEMQRGVKERGRGDIGGYNILYEYFPNASVIADNGERCEKKYYYCSIPL